MASAACRQLPPLRSSRQNAGKRQNRRQYRRLRPLSTDNVGMGQTYRYPDDLLRRILAGCETGEEWWAPHPYFPVRVSNLGRVRGVRGYVLKPYLHDGRYPAVDIYGRRHVRVHTLALETFIGPRPDGMEACHWDNVKTNVKLSQPALGYAQCQPDSTATGESRRSAIPSLASRASATTSRAGWRSWTSWRSWRRVSPTPGRCGRGRTRGHPCRPAAP